MIGVNVATQPYPCTAVVAIARQPDAFALIVGSRNGVARRVHIELFAGADRRVYEIPAVEQRPVIRDGVTGYESKPLVLSDSNFDATTAIVRSEGCHPVSIDVPLRAPGTPGSPLESGMVAGAPSVAQVSQPPAQPGCQPDSEAHLISAAPVQYPDMARAQGATGSVIVAVDLDPNGLPRALTISKSSNFAALDHAAMAAARSSTYAPAIRDCKPVFSRFLDPIVFPG